MTYSLWNIEHESIYRVNAIKVKDTNSLKEVERWSDGLYRVASFYRKEEEINAEYLQTFEAE